MKSKQQTRYEQESLSPKQSAIAITIVIIIALLADSISNLF